MKGWTRTSEKLPENGVVIDTISPTGMEQALKRSENLWFFPDGSMYVYYVPQFWREIKQKD